MLNRRELLRLYGGQLRVRYGRLGLNCLPDPLVGLSAGTSLPVPGEDLLRLPDLALHDLEVILELRAATASAALPGTCLCEAEQLLHLLLWLGLVHCSGCSEGLERIL